MIIEDSRAKGKRYRATFLDAEGEKLKTVNFGAATMDSYPIHRDDARRQRFRDRFGKLIRENVSDITRPITLANQVLWNRPTVAASLRDVSKRYKIKVKDNRQDGIK